MTPVFKCLTVYCLFLQLACSSLSPGVPELTPFLAISQGATLTKPSSDAYLFVANNGAERKPGNVVVYHVGNSIPVETITQGIGIPSALAIGAEGDLYVANNATTSQLGTVTVYAPKTLKLLRTVTDGVNGPDGLAFDRAGNLYVANFDRHTVTVYAPGSTEVLRTISNGVAEPESLTFDTSGHLFVVNYDGFKGHGSVTKYASESTQLLATITRELTFPPTPHSTARAIFTSRIPAMRTR